MNTIDRGTKEPNITIGLHRSTISSGPTYELQISGFPELVSSHETFAMRSHASIYTDDEGVTNTRVEYVESAKLWKSIMTTLQRTCELVTLVYHL